MKKIEAIIRSSKFEDVKDALSEIDINFFSFSEVRGYGKQQGKHVVYRGAVYDVGYIARLKLEIAVPDEKSKEVARTIRSAANTGEVGDGKIFIFPIEEVIRIRTGEVNESAV